MKITKKNILETLSYVLDPDSKKNLKDLEAIKNIEIVGDNIKITLSIDNPAMHYRKRIKDACEHYLTVNLKQKINTEFIFETKKKEEKLSIAKKIIAIASGKGGVGKSTITANIAVGLVQKGYNVGLVDADIYGPSIPTMLDVPFEKPKIKEINNKRYILPVETSYGVKVMSIGFFADTQQAIVWRGPMASKALEQMFKDVYWDNLDYLLIDLPPGTGDIHLTIIQHLKLFGAIIVSTPQPISLIDAKKGISMFKLKSVNVPIIGIIENMSYFFTKDKPEEKHYIFGKNGAKNLAEDKNISFLGQIPIQESIRKASDVGHPVILQKENNLIKNAFNKIISNIIKI